MSKFDSPLNAIKIASPCAADWNQMIGGERQRFCGECQLNVYNLSGMTRDEAEKLLITSEGRLCVRFYKRADGTILTKDCPVGWRALKKRISKTAAAFASLLFGILSGLGLYAFTNRAERQTQRMGEITYVPNVKPAEEIEPLVGAVYIDSKLSGEDVNNEPVSIMGKPTIAVEGGITNIEEVRRQIKQKHRR